MNPIHGATPTRMAIAEESARNQGSLSPGRPNVSSSTG